jgi:FkbM family methyltransferase
MENHKKRIAYYNKVNINFKKVLDIGAYEGNWTKSFKEFYPNADVLMIEANTEKEEILKEVGNYKIAVLGKIDDEEVDYYKCLDGTPTGNGIYPENTEYKFIPEKRKAITLSTLLNSEDGFDLIKMDVQGAERDIIQGSLPIMAKTKFLLLELQTVQYTKGTPRFSEMVAYLHDLGFEFIDIFDLKYDRDCLIEMDGLFINRNIEIENES